MSREDYFVRFAAALYAAFRTDNKPTTAARDIERALGEARLLAEVAAGMPEALDDVAPYLEHWRLTLEAQ
jgi:hypothetical protein